MKCPKCSFKLKDGECPICGYVLPAGVEKIESDKLRLTVTPEELLMPMMYAEIRKNGKNWEQVLEIIRKWSARIGDQKRKIAESGNRVKNPFMIGTGRVQVESY